MSFSREDRYRGRVSVEATLGQGVPTQGTSHLPPLRPQAQPQGEEFSDDFIEEEEEPQEEEFPDDFIEEEEEPQEEEFPDDFIEEEEEPPLIFERKFLTIDRKNFLSQKSIIIPGSTDFANHSCGICCVVMVLLQYNKLEIKLNIEGEKSNFLKTVSPHLKITAQTFLKQQLNMQKNLLNLNLESQEYVKCKSMLEKLNELFPESDNTIVKVKTESYNIIKENFSELWNNFKSLEWAKLIEISLNDDLFRDKLLLLCDDLKINRDSINNYIERFHQLLLSYLLIEQLKKLNLYNLAFHVKCQELLELLNNFIQLKSDLQVLVEKNENIGLMIGDQIIKKFGTLDKSKVPNDIVEWLSNNGVSGLRDCFPNKYTDTQSFKSFVEESTQDNHILLLIFNKDHCCIAQDLKVYSTSKGKSFILTYIDPWWNDEQGMVRKFVSRNSPNNKSVTITNSNGNRKLTRILYL